MSKVQANAVLAAFRLVVRGNDASGKRVRRVKNVMASDAGEAAEKGEAMAQEAGKGLSNIYFNVYPPVGELCRGGLSKGFELIGGLVVKTGKAPVAQAPATPKKVKAIAAPKKTVVKAKTPKKVKAEPTPVTTEAAAPATA